MNKFILSVIVTINILLSTTLMYSEDMVLHVPSDITMYEFQSLICKNKDANKIVVGDSFNLLEIKDISTLKILKNLISLTIINVGGKLDLSFINECDKLEFCKLVLIDEVNMEDFIKNDSLKIMDLQYINKILNIDSLNPSLVSFSISYCKDVNKFTQLKHLTLLQELDIRNSWKYTYDAGYDQYFKSLKKICIPPSFDSLDLEKIVKTNKDLTSIIIGREHDYSDFEYVMPSKMTSLPSSLKSSKLENIELYYCPYVNDISILANIPSLKSITIFECPGINIEPLSLSLTQIRSIELFKVGMNGMDYSANKYLESIALVTSNIDNISCVSNNVNLRILSVADSMIDKVPLLPCHNILVEFNLFANNELKDITNISSYKNLKVLDLSLCKNITSLKVLHKLQYLNEIYFPPNVNVQEINELLDNIRSIKIIHLYYCKNIDEEMLADIAFRYNISVYTEYDEYLYGRYINNREWVERVK